MLSAWLSEALGRARYELADGSFYGEVPALRGVWATGETLEECRKELAEVAEEWVFLRISRGLAIPSLGGIRLRIRKTA